MTTTNLKLVTIIAEAVLEERLIKEIRQCGAKGFTIDEVRGAGSRGVRANEWEGRNVRIETIVSDEVSDRILAALADHYFPSYAVIGYVEKVEVVRGEKYV